MHFNWTKALKSLVKCNELSLCVFLITLYLMDVQASRGEVIGVDQMINSSHGMFREINLRSVTGISLPRVGICSQMDEIPTFVIIFIWI